MDNKKLEKILRKKKQTEKLLDKLEIYIQDSNFKDAIDAYADGLIGNSGVDDLNINLLYEKLFEFVNEKLPLEVQEKFYYDVRGFIDDYVDIEEP